jgi:predicted PurR-regulated permease PerM
MTKQIIRIGAAVMTTLLALFILWQFRIVVIYVLISLALAAALRPFVTRLAGRGFLVRAGWILLYLAVLGGFGFLLFLTGSAALNEIQQLGHSVSTQDAWKLPMWLGSSSFQQTLTAQLPPPSKLFAAITGNQGQLVLPDLLGFSEGIGSLASAIAVILILSIYWGISQVHFERLWLSLLHSGQRKQARGIWRTVEPDLGAYIRSQLLHSLLAGLILGLGYWALGSPYPALLALTGALACLVPIVGAPLAMIPVLLVGLLTGVQLSLSTVLYTLLVLIALRIWVKPRLFKRKWDNPILTLVILLALASAFGLIGIIVAPPISVVCQILWSRLVSRRAVLGASTQISDLKERQARLWATIKVMEVPPGPLVTSSMERLACLIEQAEPILQTGLPIVNPLAEASEPYLAPQPVIIDAGPTAVKP